MTTNEEKFKKIVSSEKTTTLQRSRKRIKNRSRLRESQDIALKVLTKLDELGWSQKKLAEKLSVSPQQITKIVKGKENLTLETQVKLQEVLEIPILASFYEKNITKFSFEEFSEVKVSINNHIVSEGKSFYKEQFTREFKSVPRKEIAKDKYHLSEIA
ncbi:MULTISPECIES: helix-turn-helix transcriptional regulator [Galbibacter]|uniref:Plasmid maintenance system antidote protein n=1 Tax=Galbibacter orientalis DSM 19592 TaxID=926559 RepID=I3C3D2_9FLAO|nr:helix-turn-helix transcriptional regulator [Galbibacter orientalis]EIJ38125.1 plasmid maintenance system antidote protein [Galbibacter orientalis DSM 19592]